MFEKLIRDKVPEVASISGENLRCAQDDREYLAFLRKKLKEEVGEFLRSEAIEELADIAEVLDALSCFLGSSPIDLMQAKESKRDRLGGFERRFVMRVTAD